MSEVKLQPWELAKKEGKTIICRVIGPMIAVYYPYRHSGDLYVGGPDGPNQVVHCCQDGCDKDFPVSDFIEHVNGHNRALKRFPHLIVDSKLVAPEIRDQIEKYEPKPSQKEMPL